jgi:hypothetical protein
LLVPNRYTVCNELQTYERINRNNKKIKELDENEWNSPTCMIIQLKSAFVDVLASESGSTSTLSYTITTVSCVMSYENMKESTETTRNSRSLMKMNGMQQHASFN